MTQSKVRKYFSPARLIIYAFVVVLFLIVISNLVIVFFSSGSVYSDIEDLKPHKTAIVLGTSPRIKSGQPNPYFHYRISAAAELYHQGKVQYIILSGDNRTRHYNEPEQMRREIIKYNVPDSVLYLDYAGLRTLDSMVRSKAIFGQDSIIVVSQKFHNQRAVFLARINGIKAVGYNATDIDRRTGVRTNVREIFARVKVFYDLLTRKQPRHLGDQIEIGSGQKR